MWNTDILGAAACGIYKTLIQILLISTTKYIIFCWYLNYFLTAPKSSLTVFLILFIPYHVTVRTSELHSEVSEISLRLCAKTYQLLLTCTERPVDRRKRLCGPYIGNKSQAKAKCVALKASVNKFV